MKSNNHSFLATKTLICVCMLTFLWISISNAQVSPHEMVQRMGRGINLGNTLSAPIEGNWAPPVEESYFEDVVSAGFSTVRIPIRFDMHTTTLEEVTYVDDIGMYIGSVDDFTVESAYLDRIEEVVGWALDRDLIAIIDVHGDKWFWESFDPDRTEYKTGPHLAAAKDRFRAIWKAISERFQYYPDQLLFEIMNEPYFSMDENQVHAVNMDILGIIRNNNPSRNVIITGGGKNSWEAPFTIKDELLSSDAFLIPTFHYYLPRAFTVSSREEFNDFDWGTEADKQQVDQHFEAVKNWADSKGLPVLLGEFGADNAEGYNYAKGTYSLYGGPEEESREQYHGYLAEAAISRGFCFTAWDAGEKSNKAIYLVSNRSWVEGVKDALLGRQVSVLNNQNNTSVLSIYPNPVLNVINFITKKPVMIYQIINSDGSVILNDHFEDNTINVGQLYPGLYYLNVLFFDGDIAKQAFIKMTKTSE